MNNPDELLTDLNQEQTTAVTHGEGPLLIVAGAGTGKTTVITRRIAWLIEQGRCKPEEILALTFTEKAAGEMEERVDRLLPYGYVNLWISTFHAFCQRILERHGLDIGIPHRFRLLDQTAAWLLVRKNFDRFNLDYYRPLGNPTKFIHALLQHFSRAKDEAILPEDYLRYAQGLRLSTDAENKGALHEDGIKRAEEIADAYHVYQQLLLENDALDFGDLLVYTRELFVNRPGILERYRGQFTYLLIDEFQDTNWVQYEIVKLLGAPRNNVTVVGDDDQAIFLWRGASYHNIIQFKKDFPKSHETFLTLNYRSGQGILDAAHSFIQSNNPDRLEWQLGEGNTERVLSKKLIAQRTSPGTIEHIHCATLDEEAEAVSTKILELKAGNESLVWNDFAILVRANDSAQIFIEQCTSANIPYQFFSLKGLYAKPIILDIIAYCKLLDNYHEGPSLWRVLNVPFLHITTESLIGLTHYAHQHGLSLWNACQKVDLISESAAEDKQKIKNITAAITRHATFARTRKVGEVFLSVVRDAGYLGYLKDADTEEKRESLELLDQFYKKIRTFQGEFSHAKIKDFLELIALEQEAGDRGALSSADQFNDDVVHIQTCHSAKGLEFRYVFIVNLVDRRFPTVEREDAIELPRALIKEVVPQGDAHLEEERRLFYVALTRAKDTCFLLSSEDYGGVRKKKPSRFLAELGFANDQQALKPKEIALPVIRESGSNIHVNLPLPATYSYSQLAAFQKCPLQYKFAFLLKIPVFGKASLSFGRTLHETLHRFFEFIKAREATQQQSLFISSEKGYTETRESSLPGLEELLRIYEESWIDEWYINERQSHEYREKGRDILKRFHAELVNQPPSPRWLEKDFTIKVGSGDTIHTIKGRIDRIDTAPDGTVEIIDYKTGASKDGENFKAEDKEQLLFYQIAVEEVLQEKPISLTYYYLDDGKKISFLGTDEEKEKLKTKAATIIEKIQKSDFAPTPGWNCKFCDFRDICEFRKY